MKRALQRVVQRRTFYRILTRHVNLRARGSDLGVRIVLASDIHARPDWFPRELAEQFVDAVNAVDDVDLVALVGDFVGDDAFDIEWSSEEYSRITAPTFAVLGNHDHWTDSELITTALEAAGIPVLSNAALPLVEATGGSGDSGAWLAGLDSCWTRKKRGGPEGPGTRPDIAFRDIPRGADVVVLGHEPHLATLHEHTLHLAGHTHCGQIRTPILGTWLARKHMPRFSEPFPAYLHEVPVESDRTMTDLTTTTARDRRWIYTTAGVGYSTIDTRVLCPPEIVVIDA